MKNTILLLTVLGLLAACSASPEMGANTKLPTCENPAIPFNCSNNPNSGPNDPTVNFNKNSLNLAPPNVCTNQGATLKFKITPTAANQNPPGNGVVSCVDPRVHVQ